MYAIVNIIYGVPLMGRETRKRTTRGIEVDEPLCLEVARDYPSDKGGLALGNLMCLAGRLHKGKDLTPWDRKLIEEAIETLRGFNYPV